MKGPRRPVTGRSIEEEEERALRQATRRLLFGRSAEKAFPGEGESAAKAPRRHMRVKVTINLDGDVVEHFKEQARRDSRKYQFLINQALREYIEGTSAEKLARTVGEILLSDESFVECIRERLKDE